MQVLRDKWPDVEGTSCPRDPATFLGHAELPIGQTYERRDPAPALLYPEDFGHPVADRSRNELAALRPQVFFESGLELGFQVGGALGWRVDPEGEFLSLGLRDIRKVLLHQPSPDSFLAPVIGDDAPQCLAQLVRLQFIQREYFRRYRREGSIREEHVQV